MDSRTLHLAVLLAAGTLSVPVRAQSVRLNGPLTRQPLGSAGLVTLAPDGNHAVLVRDLETSGPAFGLYSARLDRAEEPILLHEFQLPSLLGAVQVTADSARVVYLRNTNRARLYSVPIEGGNHVVLNAPLVGNVRAFELTPHGAAAVYSADQDVERLVELYLVPADRSASPRKLNQALTPGGLGVADFRLSADGTHVVYRADPTGSGRLGLFVTPLDGSATPLRLDRVRPQSDVKADYRFSADGRFVVYRHDADQSGIDELFRVPLDGSAASEKLSGPLTPFGTVRAFELASVGTQVVYLADQLVRDQVELFAVVSGAPPVRLNGALAPNADVGAVVLSPSGARVAFRTQNLFVSASDGSSAPVEVWRPPDTVSSLADIQVPDETHVLFQVARSGILSYPLDRLFSAPLDGSAAPLELDPRIDNTGEVLDVLMVRPDGTVVYLADVGGAREFELWATPLDHSTSPRRLSDELVPGGSVSGGRLSANGERLVYGAFQDQAPEVFVVPFAGGASRRISGETPLGPPLGSAALAALAADSERCVFYANQVEGNGLYSAPCDASEAPRGITEFFREGRYVAGQRFTPAGDQLVLSVVENGQIRLYSVASDLRGPRSLLTGPPRPIGRFAVTTQEVVYSIPSVTTRIGVATLDGSDRRDFPGRPVLSEFAMTGDGTRAAFVSAPGLWVFELASGVLTRLDQPVVGGQIGGGFDGATPGLFQLTPDGQRALYLANHHDLTVLDLYTAPLDASAAPIRLSIPGPAPTGVVHGTGQFFELSPDGARVVWLERGATQIALTSAPSDGSGPSIVLARGSGSSFFRIAPDSRHVLFQADLVTPGMTELFVLAIDGSSTPRRLSGPLVAGGDVGFAAFGPAFDIGRNGQVVYAADARVNERVELFGVPFDGSSAPVSLNATLVPNGDVVEFALAGRGERVVYRADGAVDEQFELYDAASDGSGRVRPLNAPLLPAGDVISFQLTPDGRRAIYRADQDFDDVFELFTSPIARPVLRR